MGFVIFLTNVFTCLSKVDIIYPYQPILKDSTMSYAEIARRIALEELIAGSEYL